MQQGPGGSHDATADHDEPGETVATGVHTRIGDHCVTLDGVNSIVISQQ